MSARVKKHTSASILRLLADRHAKDTWVPECKLGSSWAGARRLDGWALRSTWSPVTTVGYEVKVSRSDFVRDDKWPDYLPCCHLLYFVSPPGVISKDEVPEGCGLIHAGARLVTRVKAPRREPHPEALVDLMTYVLMSRVQIVANMWEAGPSGRGNLAFWRQWLEERGERADLGRSVSRQLHRELDKARLAQRAAEQVAQRAEWFREALRLRGIDPDAAPSEWRARRRVDEALGVLDKALPRDLENRLVNLHRALANGLQAVRELREAAGG